MLDFPRPYRQAALAFFLLHWDVAAWSSFLNMKEILVMTLTLAALHEALRFFGRPSPGPVLFFFAALGALLFLRFYVPFVLLLAVFGYLLEKERSLRRTAALLLIAAAILGLAWWRFDGGMSFARYLRPAEIFWGIPHFLLTPLPWNLSPGYRFLYVPSWLWLALAAPSLGAIPFLWRRHPHARLLFIYLGLLVLLYAVAPDLRGPRHRVQVTFLFAWMEFHALWAFGRRLSASLDAAAHGDPARSAQPGQGQA
jgi:hypothetical protein